MKAKVIAYANFGWITVVLTILASPTLAYWQFIERPPGFEVKPSPKYTTKKDCEAAIKKVEATLKKAYPNRYPLVGSCEEYR